MALTVAQMRAIELNLEQQDRFSMFSSCYPKAPIDKIVERFYESDFEMMILDKIGKLLAPNSQEDLNLVVRM